VPLIPKVAPEPGIAVQVTPSAEVEAVAAEPARSTRKYAGTVPAIVSTVVTGAAKLARSSTQIPDPA
jgi:hypothetical protein